MIGVYLIGFLFGFSAAMAICYLSIKLNNKDKEGGNYDQC